MNIDWSIRVRNYRSKSNLTQEQLAAIFGVESRTVQRWEAGRSMPPDHVQRALARTPVPPIIWPTINGIMQLIEASDQYVILFDRDLRVVSNSRAHKLHMHRQFGIDVVGMDWTHYMPTMFLDMIYLEGGRDAMYRRGLSSLTCDYYRAKDEPNGNRLENFGRVTQTVLRLDGGHCFELAMSRDIEKSAYVEGRPTPIYLDDIMAND